MLFGKMIAVFRDNDTKHINEPCGEDAEILVLKIPGGTYSAPLFFYLGATAPIGPRPPHYRRFMVILRHTPRSVGLVMTNDQLGVEIST